MSKRPDKYTYVVIGLVACSMLVHEILLTRICALRLYFHFAFLVISNCLLGLGASGALLLVFGARLRADRRLWHARLSAIYTLSLVVTYIFLLKCPLPTDLSLDRFGHIALLSLFNLAGAVPFVFGGLLVGMLLTFETSDVHRLYACDLIGAAIGCILCPLLLPSVGAGGAFLVATLLGLLSTAVSAQSKAARSCVFAFVAVCLSLLPTLDTRRPVPSKGFMDLASAYAARQRLGPPYRVWTSNSRIDLMRVAKGTPFGMFMRGTRTEGIDAGQLEWAGISQDAVAGTAVGNFSDQPAAIELLRRSMYVAAYRLRPGADVLVIGLGGGNDVWSALDNQAHHVKAFELNWPIVDIHRRVLPTFSRNLVNDPRVDLVVDEGRSGLLRDRATYDVVQMTGIDTWTALASGAYVLAENYLYTPEAIVAMYRRLKPNGILQISRFSADMEALRLLSNIDSALRSIGVADFENSISVLATDDNMMAVQLKKGPFSDAEQASTAGFAQENGIRVLYLPGRRSTRMGLVETFIRDPERQQMVDRFPMNIGPTSDDRPYFFNYTKWQHPFDSYAHLHDIPSVSQGNPLFLLSQLALSIFWSALFIVFPVARLGRLPSGVLRHFVFFACLGLGFVFVEIAVIQKLTLFLGQPVYSLTTTLFSLLCFTGIGSALFAERATRRRVWLVPLGIAGYLGVFSVVARLLVEHAIGLPIGLRIALTAASLAPLGLLLGIPFAFGLRVMQQTHPTLAPWAWAINGSFSVVGSVLTVIVSMNFGFYAVLALAALLYVVGFGVFLSGHRTSTA